MNAKELQQQLNTSLLWFAALLVGGSLLGWSILSNWPDDAAAFWVIRGVVLTTHLLIWRKSVGPLYDVPHTGKPPAWLTLAHNAWLCALLLFQTACVVCLPIADMLSFGAALDFD